MKNLSKNEMNAVVGGNGPKSSVAGGLGGITVKTNLASHAEPFGKGNAANYFK